MKANDMNNMIYIDHDYPLGSRVLDGYICQIERGKILFHAKTHGKKLARRLSKTYGLTVLHWECSRHRGVVSYDRGEKTHEEFSKK